MIVVIANIPITVHCHTRMQKHTNVNMQSDTLQTHTHTHFFVSTFWSARQGLANIRSICSCVWWHMSLRTLFESGRSLFVPTGSLIIVHGCMVIDSRPWAHPSPAIMSLVRGEYKVNMISGLSGYFLVDGVMSEVLPRCDFTGSRKPLKLSTAGSFFQRLMEEKSMKGFSWSVSPDCLCVTG